jgi:hypothetical protein
MAAGLANVMVELRAPAGKSPYGVAGFEALRGATEGLRKRSAQLARVHKQQDAARRELQEGAAEEARLLAGLRVYLAPQDEGRGGARVRRTSGGSTSACRPLHHQARQFGCFLVSSS